METNNGGPAGRRLETAAFAGGCFWCIEEAFHAQPGVVEALPGYTGGRTPAPTYEQVCGGRTGHYEAVRVTFDPAVVTFPALLDVFWRHIDPTDDGGQFADRGPQYRTAVFCATEEQRRQTLESIRRLQEGGRYARPIRTAVLPAGPFYPAEEYHREYYRKQPGRYCAYKSLSGRAAYVERNQPTKP